MVICGLGSSRETARKSSTVGAAINWTEVGCFRPAIKKVILKLDFYRKSAILFSVMRDTTQQNLRNEGIAIAEVRGALQILAQTNLIGKEAIQIRIEHWEEKLADVQNRLTEIENSEDLEWLEDKAGIEA